MVRRAVDCKLIISADTGLSALPGKFKMVYNSGRVKCELSVLGKASNPFILVSESCWD